jgi:hypothetical protein
MLVKNPTAHPKMSRVRMSCANSMAHTEGTIRKEKTSRTPAIFTELVTTNPNET